MRISDGSSDVCSSDLSSGSSDAAVICALPILRKPGSRANQVAAAAIASAGTNSHGRDFRENFGRSAKVGSLLFVARFTAPFIGRPGDRGQLGSVCRFLHLRTFRTCGAGPAAGAVHAEAERTHDKAGQDTEQNGGNARGDQPGPVQRQTGNDRDGRNDDEAATATQVVAESNEQLPREGDRKRGGRGKGVSGSEEIGGRR